MAALDVAFLVALVGFTSWLGYVGFIASDDGSYSEAAIGWLDHFLTLGSITGVCVMPWCCLWP